MAVQNGTTLRTADGTAFITTVGASPKVIIYTGTQPANCGTAASGTVLTTFTLSATPATSSGGVLTVSGTPIASTATGTGTAGYYRVYDSGVSTCHEQGTVGTSATDLIIDNASITSGQTVNITGWTKTYAGA